MSLVANHISVQRGMVPRTILSGVSLTVQAGEMIGLIGPNGAGKTTLLNLLTGVYQPSAGTIAVEEHDLTGRAPHEYASHGVARTFQLVRVLGAATPPHR